MIDGVDCASMTLRVVWCEMSFNDASSYGMGDVGICTFPPECFLPDIALLLTCDTLLTT